MLTKEEIKKMLELGLPGAIIIVNGDDGVHFDATVISEQFTDLSRVKQQQLVYQVLDEHLRSGALHALALKTYTPTQWANRDSNI